MRTKSRARVAADRARSAAQGKQKAVRPAPPIVWGVTMTPADYTRTAYDKQITYALRPALAFQAASVPYTDAYKQAAAKFILDYKMAGGAVTE